MGSNKGRQATWWILTIPRASFSPDDPLPPGVRYITGQCETAPTTGYEHWQICVNFYKKIRLGGVKAIFQGAHCEPTLGESAEYALTYCHKEETRIEGTEFSAGTKPINRARSTDWAIVLEAARHGRFTEIPGDIQIRYYGNLRRIMVDNLKPIGIAKEVIVYYGKTGTGKSTRAWQEAGLDAFPKDPLTKWWDSYQGQPHIVIDEFRGILSISHLLRWFDCFPFIMETKGSCAPPLFTRIWITSNLHPREWYPDIDPGTYDALRRRLRIYCFDTGEPVLELEPDMRTLRLS